jgi:hypothetical protein
MLKGDELYAQMTTLKARYQRAMERHDLGAALGARDDAAKLLCANFANVVAALELWAFPLSHGALPDEQYARCPTPLDPSGDGSYRGPDGAR